MGLGLVNACRILRKILHRNSHTWQIGLVVWMLDFMG